MVCFLTSKIDAPDTGKLNTANHFLDELLLRFPKPCRALYVCSDPDCPETTDFYASCTKTLFEDAGFSFEQFETLDGRNENRTAKLVRASNMLILSGGHVPTQNRYYKRIGLRELLKEYPGIVIGISAGSMNSADRVYAQPEDEAVDPMYQRFLTGLNLTKTNLLPHYQENREKVLDGMKLYEEITCADSLGKTFCAIPDGTYLFIDGPKEELRGEAYRVSDGCIKQVSAQEETIRL